MTEADDYFQRPVAVLLDQTFRFGPRLADLSSAFVAKNPQQIPKVVRSNQPEASRSACLWWTNWDRDRALVEIVTRLATEEDVTGRSLLILARYGHFLPKPTTMRKLAELWPGELRNSSTIHAAKGLEADHVVLLDVRDVIPFSVGGRLSLPSSLSDDPLLALVMPRRETFPHAEERRLFYVALSRARLRVDLICHRLYPSVLASELASQPEAVSLGSPALEIECAVCVGRAAELPGRIAWQGSQPLSCTNPTCGFVPPRCERCRTGFLMPQPQGSSLRCVEAMCEHEADLPVSADIVVPGSEASLTGSGPASAAPESKPDV